MFVFVARLAAVSGGSTAIAAAVCIAGAADVRVVIPGVPFLLCRLNRHPTCHGWQRWFVGAALTDRCQKP